MLYYHGGFVWAISWFWGKSSIKKLSFWTCALLLFTKYLGLQRPFGASRFYKYEWYCGSSIISMTASKNFLDSNWNLDNRGIPLNDICISLNKFNFLNFRELLKTPGFLLLLYITVFQYIEEFPIKEELELIFSIANSI